MTLIRAGAVRRKCAGTLVLLLGFVASCGRVADESPMASGGAVSGGMPSLGGSAGTAANSGVPARGGSNDAGSPALPSGGFDTVGSGGASGSTDEGGAAGAAGTAADLPVPPDCEAHERSATDADCALNVTCHGQQNSIKCERLASGAWQCSCAVHSERTLEIEGATGLQACAAAAGPCSATELTLGEETCTDDPDYPRDDQCGVDLHCRKPVIIDQQLPDVQATLVQSGRASCERLVAPNAPGEQAPYSCTCLGTPHQSYTVLDNDTAHACRAVLDFCLSGKQPSFVATSACTVNAQLAGDCKSLQLCGPQMPLSGAAALIDTSSQRELSCTQLESNERACDCVMESTPQTSVGSSYSFHVPDLTLSTCDPAQCRPGVTPVATGPVGDCRHEQYNDGPNLCVFSCPVPASIEGHQVTIDAPLSVSCAKRTSDNTWWCSCGSGTSTARFEVGAATDTEQACELAPAHCLAQISLALGPVPWGGAPLPNPLP